ncbi:hypothetical protein HERIO_2535 [Hepatospora eriocheir]|uniref:Uncharacterized protein n=1 Tax=Hepatospora eriocheir TaxID=1081669 RepID=A0A1X0Q6K1_9MICR|nr:hypothetical protein HERIO_2535 [Hepatospora eriocheir]
MRSLSETLIRIPFFFILILFCYNLLFIVKYMIESKNSNKSLESKDSNKTNDQNNNTDRPIYVPDDPNLITV